MISKPIYISEINGTYFDCEKWQYSKPDNYGEKTRRTTPTPTLNRTSTQTIDNVNIEDYEFLMSLGDKKFYILVEFKVFRDETNAYKIKFHDRLDNIRRLQTEAKKCSSDCVYDPENYLPWLSWDQIELCCKKIIGNPAHLPKPIKGFTWILYSDVGDLCGTEMYLEVDFGNQKYNRHQIISVS